MNGHTGADEIGNDLCLQIGEGQHEIRLEFQDFRDVGRYKRGNARLLAPDLRWPDGIAGDPDDAVLFAKQIQGLDRLFRETHDPAGREVTHPRDMVKNKSFVTK